MLAYLFGNAFNMQSLLRSALPFANGALLPVGACAAMAELVDAQR